jgi:hypothetical protein
LRKGVKGRGEKKARDFGGFDGEKGYHGTRNGSPTLCVWMGERERESLALGFLGCFRRSLMVCKMTMREMKKEKIQEEKKNNNNILMIENNILII